MRARFGAFLSLLTVVLVAVGIAAGIAELWHSVGGAALHRAFVLVFLGGGGTLAVFALMTHGAETTGGAMTADLTLERLIRVPPDDRIKLNPTGALVIAAIVLIALGLLFDARFA